MTVSFALDHASTAELSPTRRASSRIHRIWPVALMGTGLVLTAAWACLLGYGLVELITLVI
jgi:hypothetical protein